MTHVLYRVFFTIIFLSCAPMVSAASLVYHEVPDLTRVSDYSTDNKIQTLDIAYRDLSLKLRYISDRAYLSVENGRDTRVDWKPVKINFFYDISFDGAEKDIHLLLKKNDTKQGYLLFPAFTEEYASYFVYAFKGNALDYLGNYAATDFGKGTFSFNEASKELTRSSDKISRFTKEDAAEKNDFQHVATDLKLLNAHQSTRITKDWIGYYEGSFLRLKDESADPRAWGTLNVKIGTDTATFHLDSYKEQIRKNLKVIFSDAKKIQLAVTGNDKQILTIVSDKNTYALSGSLMEQIIGTSDTYGIEKK